LHIYEYIMIWHDIPQLCKVLYLFVYLLHDSNRINLIFKYLIKYITKEVCECNLDYDIKILYVYATTTQLWSYQCILQDLQPVIELCRQI